MHPHCLQAVAVLEAQLRHHAALVVVDPDADPRARAQVLTSLQAILRIFEADSITIYPSGPGTTLPQDALAEQIPPAAVYDIKVRLCQSARATPLISRIVTLMDGCWSEAASTEAVALTWPSASRIHPSTSSLVSTASHSSTRATVWPPQQQQPAEMSVKPMDAGRYYACRIAAAMVWAEGSSSREDLLYEDVLPAVGKVLESGCAPATCAAVVLARRLLFWLDEDSHVLAHRQGFRVALRSNIFAMLPHLMSSRAREPAFAGTLHHCALFLRLVSQVPDCQALLQGTLEDAATVMDQLFEHFDPKVRSLGASLLQELVLGRALHPVLCQPALQHVMGGHVLHKLASRAGQWQGITVAGRVAACQLLHDLGQRDPRTPQLGSCLQQMYGSLKQLLEVGQPQQVDGAVAALAALHGVDRVDGDGPKGTARCSSRDGSGSWRLRQLRHTSEEEEEEEAATGKERQGEEEGEEGSTSAASGPCPLPSVQVKALESAGILEVLVDLAQQPAAMGAASVALCRRVLRDLEGLMVGGQSVGAHALQLVAEGVVAKLVELPSTLPAPPVWASAVGAANAMFLCPAAPVAQPTAFEGAAAPSAPVAVAGSSPDADVGGQEPAGTVIDEPLAPLIAASPSLVLDPTCWAYLARARFESTLPSLQQAWDHAASAHLVPGWRPFCTELCTLVASLCSMEGDGLLPDSVLAAADGLMIHVLASLLTLLQKAASGGSTKSAVAPHLRQEQFVTVVSCLATLITHAHRQAKAPRRLTSSQRSSRPGSTNPLVSPGRSPRRHVHHPDAQPQQQQAKDLRYQESGQQHQDQLPGASKQASNICWLERLLSPAGCWQQQLSPEDRALLLLLYRPLNASADQANLACCSRAAAGLAEALQHLAEGGEPVLTHWICHALAEAARCCLPPVAAAPEAADGQPDQVQGPCDSLLRASSAALVRVLSTAEQKGEPAAPAASVAVQAVCTLAAKPGQPVVRLLLTSSLLEHVAAWLAPPQWPLLQGSDRRGACSTLAEVSSMYSETLWSQQQIIRHRQLLQQTAANLASQVESSEPAAVAQAVQALEHFARVPLALPFCCSTGHSDRSAQLQVRLPTNDGLPLAAQALDAAEASDAAAPCGSHPLTHPHSSPEADPGSCSWLPWENVARYAAGAGVYCSRVCKGTTWAALAYRTLSRLATRLGQWQAMDQASRLQACHLLRTIASSPQPGQQWQEEVGILMQQAAASLGSMLDAAAGDPVASRGAVQAMYVLAAVPEACGAAGQSGSPSSTMTAGGEVGGHQSAGISPGPLLAVAVHHLLSSQALLKLAAKLGEWKALDHESRLRAAWLLHCVIRAQPLDPPDQRPGSAFASVNQLVKQSVNSLLVLLEGGEAPRVSAALRCLMELAGAAGRPGAAAPLPRIVDHMLAAGVLRKVVLRLPQQAQLQAHAHGGQDAHMWDVAMLAGRLRELLVFYIPQAAPLVTAEGAACTPPAQLGSSSDGGEEEAVAALHIGLRLLVDLMGQLLEPGSAAAGAAGGPHSGGQPPALGDKEQQIALAHVVARACRALGAAPPVATAGLGAVLGQHGGSQGTCEVEPDATPSEHGGLVLCGPGLQLLLSSGVLHKVLGRMALPQAMAQPTRVALCEMLRYMAAHSAAAAAAAAADADADRQAHQRRRTPSAPGKGSGGFGGEGVEQLHACLKQAGASLAKLMSCDDPAVVAQSLQLLQALTGYMGAPPALGQALPFGQSQQQQLQQQAAGMHHAAGPRLPDDSLLVVLGSGVAGRLAAPLLSYSPDVQASLMCVAVDMLHRAPRVAVLLQQAGVLPAVVELIRKAPAASPLHSQAVQAGCLLLYSTLQQLGALGDPQGGASESSEAAVAVAAARRELAGPGLLDAAARSLSRVAPLATMGSMAGARRSSVGGALAPGPAAARQRHAGPVDLPVLVVLALVLGPEGMDGEAAGAGAVDGAAGLAAGAAAGAAEPPLKQAAAELMLQHRLASGLYYALESVLHKAGLYPDFSKRASMAAGQWAGAQLPLSAGMGVAASGRGGLQLRALTPGASPAMPWGLREVLQAAVSLACFRQQASYMLSSVTPSLLPLLLEVLQPDESSGGTCPAAKEAVASDPQVLRLACRCLELLSSVEERRTRLVEAGVPGLLQPLLQHSDPMVARAVAGCLGRLQQAAAGLSARQSEVGYEGQAHTPAHHPAGSHSVSFGDLAAAGAGAPAAQITVSPSAAALAVAGSGSGPGRLLEKHGSGASSRASQHPQQQGPAGGLVAAPPVVVPAPMSAAATAGTAPATPSLVRMPSRRAAAMDPDFLPTSHHEQPLLYTLKTSLLAARQDLNSQLGSTESALLAELEAAHGGQVAALQAGQAALQAQVEDTNARLGGEMQLAVAKSRASMEPIGAATSSTLAHIVALQAENAALRSHSATLEAQQRGMLSQMLGLRALAGRLEESLEALQASHANQQVLLKAAFLKLQGDPEVEEAGRQVAAMSTNVPLLPPIGSRPGTAASAISMGGRARAALLQASGIITPPGPPPRQQAASGFYFTRKDQWQ